MRMMLSSSFSNAFLGGLAVWAFLSAGGVLVWAAVIAWGCFFHAGGDAHAVRITIVGTFLGILTAWTAGIFLTLNPAALSPPVWAGLVVGLLTFVMVFIGHQLAVRLGLTVRVVPASFYGAAATFAYLVQTPGRLDTKALFSLSFDNALIALPISMFIGSLLGYATAKMTDALGTPSTRPGLG
jgi:Protein of unknown function (DUF1097)